MQYNTIQYNTMQYNTTQYNTIQCSAMQYNAIQQYNRIQYNNTLLILKSTCLPSKYAHIHGQLPIPKMPPIIHTNTTTCLI